MIKRLIKISGIILLNIIGFHFFSEAQPKDTSINNLIRLRDDFINEIKSLGFTPNLTPPEIILDNPPSFGNYDDSANRLEMSDWKTLPVQVQAFFNSLAQEIGNSETGESFFEKSIHHWVFIHELGHWWAAGQHVKHNHYQAEMSANRIAGAYWREKDPALLDLLAKSCHNTIANIPNPVPAGDTKENYFNSHYDKLIGTPAYSWYQSAMIIDIYNENPKPTFKNIIIPRSY